MICGTGLDLQQAKASSNVPSAALVQAATIFNATDAFTGCTRSAVGTPAFKRTQTTGALNVKELPTHRQKTTERGPGGHNLCCRCMCVYTCENRLEEIQGAAAYSFILPPLLQDSRSCVQLMFPECNASCKGDLALGKARSTTEPLSDRSAMLSQRMWLLSYQTSCWLNLILITSIKS